MKLVAEKEKDSSRYSALSTEYVFNRNQKFLESQLWMTTNKASI
jgi:hypothetical protein